MSQHKNPHLTLTLSPPIGWERRGNSSRTRTVLANPTATGRWKEISMTLHQPSPFHFICAFSIRSGSRNYTSFSLKLHCSGGL